MDEYTVCFPFDKYSMSILDSRTLVRRDRNDSFRFLASLFLCISIFETISGEEKSPKKFIFKEIYDIYPESKPTIRFGDTIKTRFTFDMQQNDILTSVVEAKGSIVVPKKDKFFLSQLLISKLDEIKDELTTSENCDDIQGDPNSYIRLHPAANIYALEEDSSSKNEWEKIKFTVTNFNINGYHESSFNFLKLSTSSYKSVYSQPYLTNEVKKKIFETTLIGRARDISKYTFDLPHTQYKFGDRTKYTEYYGTIDLLSDDCGEENSKYDKCTYQFTQDGITHIYHIYIVKEKPLLEINKKGQRKFFFHQKDKIVADRFALVHDLECNLEKIPSDICHQAKKRYQNVIEYEKSILEQYDNFEFVERKINCQEEQYIRCIHKGGFKTNNIYKQKLPKVVKASELDLKILKKSSLAACITPNENIRKKLIDVDASKMLESTDLMNYSILSISSKDRSLQSYLIEIDLQPDKISCTQVDPNVTFHNEVWLHCDFPQSLSTEYYDIRVRINNNKWKEGVSCDIRMCTSRVYYFRYDASKRNWIIRMEGDDLKGKYTIELDYISKLHQKKIKSIGINFQMEVEKIGLNFKYQTCFIIIILVLLFIILFLIFCFLLTTMALIRTFKNQKAVLAHSLDISTD